MFAQYRPAKRYCCTNRAPSWLLPYEGSCQIIGNLNISKFRQSGFLLSLVQNSSYKLFLSRFSLRLVYKIRFNYWTSHEKGQSQFRHIRFPIFVFCYQRFIVNLCGIETREVKFRGPIEWNFICKVIGNVLSLQLLKGRLRDSSRFLDYICIVSCVFSVLSIVTGFVSLLDTQLKTALCTLIWFY